MNKRAAIELNEDERRAYLTEAKTITLVSVGRDGYPHAVPMWFVVDDDGSISMTTYGRSQKVLNVRRNPRVALLVESGTHYEHLKGVLIRGLAAVIDDPEACVRTLMRIQTKHLGTLASGVEAIMRTQATKRVVLRITPERVASWDHRKLDGAY